MLNADPSKVSQRAKKRGLPQLGTLGAGNHYAEIQVVEEIFDKFAATKMGIDRLGQVCIMIHSGSRGFGHQVATDALVEMEKAMARDKIETNDRQLACARINSTEGKNYLSAMAAAANFAWVNRSSMTFLTRQVNLVTGTYFCITYTRYLSLLKMPIKKCPDYLRDLIEKSYGLNVYVNVSGICKAVQLVS